MSRKDFNKGMEAGARPFEGKFRQMGQEFKDFSDRMENDVDRIKQTNEDILDEMDSMQRKQFYRNNTVVDIATLEKGDRETLLSLLFTLAEIEENVTEYQQLFIRSVKKYLEKTEDGRKPENWSVLKDGDWSIIETIIGIEETKAIVQAVMEFLFLGYESHEEYFEEYEDLFDCFCLNQKGFGEVRAHIDNIYRATGLEGIAENYGYVPEQGEEVENTCCGASANLKEDRIADCICIAEGKEEIFENKKLILSAGIDMKGNARIVFKNCHILSDEAVPDNGNIFVHSDSTASITFTNCTIEWLDKNKEFISVAGTGKAKLLIQNSFINECTSFLRGSEDTSVIMRNSKIHLATTKTYDSYVSLMESGELHIEDSVFDMEAGDDAVSYYGELFDGVVSGDFDTDKRKYTIKHCIERCIFNNLKGCGLNTRSEIFDSIFENCFVKAMGKYEDDDKILYNAGIFKNCKFTKCVFENGRGVDYSLMKFEDVKMIECIGILPTAYLKDIEAEGGYLMIQSRFPIKMDNCRFSNWSYEKYKNTKDCKGEKIFTHYKESHVVRTADNELTIAALGASEISKCIFDNLQVGQTHLIGGICYGGQASFKISNCQFSNICTDSGTILRKAYKHEESYGLFGRKSKIVTQITEMNIQDCTGL